MEFLYLFCSAKTGRKSENSTIVHHMIEVHTSSIPERQAKSTKHIRRASQKNYLLPNWNYVTRKYIFILLLKITSTSMFLKNSRFVNKVERIHKGWRIIL